MNVCIASFYIHTSYVPQWINFVYGWVYIYIFLSFLDTEVKKYIKQKLETDFIYVPWKFPSFFNILSF